MLYCGLVIVKEVQNAAIPGTTPVEGKFIGAEIKSLVSKDGEGNQQITDSITVSKLGEGS